MIVILNFVFWLGLEIWTQVCQIIVFSVCKQRSTESCNWWHRSRSVCHTCQYCQAYCHPRPGWRITVSNEGNMSQSPGAQIARIFICLHILSIHQNVSVITCDTMFWLCAVLFPPSNVSIMPSEGPMLTLTLCLLTKMSMTLQSTWPKITLHY